MHPHARPPHLLHDPAPCRRSSAGVGHVADALEAQALPSLTQILQHYREHGTVARTVAAWHPTLPQDLPAAPPSAGPSPFAEPIEGLHTRELDGSELFEQFFGPEAR